MDIPSNNMMGNTGASLVLHDVTPSENDKHIGRLDHLAKIAGYLMRGGAEANIKEYLEDYAFGKYQLAYESNHKAAKDDVHMAIQQAIQEVHAPTEMSMAHMVREFIREQDGTFLLQNIYKELSARNRSQRKNIRVILARLIKKGIVEKSGKQSGCYDKVDTELITEDWQNANENSAPIWLPFDLDLAVIPYGSIILFSGSPNSGKTATLMNIAMENMNRFDVHYYSSEIGPGAFKRRAAKFPYLTTDQWKVRFHPCYGDFHKVVQKGVGKLLIFDYLELHDSFWLVADILNKIHKRLDGAIAVVAIQKEYGKDLGRGGSHTLEKPQLAVALDSGTAKITKLKEWKEGYENPNKKIFTFKLVDGCQIKKQMGWHYPQK